MRMPKIFIFARQCAFLSRTNTNPNAVVDGMKRLVMALGLVILGACSRGSLQNSHGATLEDFIEGAGAVAIGMTEVETAAGRRGRRASWALTMGQGNTTRTVSTWVWEVEPGGKLLIVSVEGGKASQPYVRTYVRAINPN
jgi:hypothetical protein